MLAEDVMDKLGSKKLVAPSLFLAFGSPMQAIDFDEYNESLCNFLESIPFPRSILIISPFWQTDTIQINASDFHDLLYDFDEGPETLKLLTYPCAGNPELARKVKIMLESRGIKSTLNTERGLDKGCWVPLYVAFPDMDVPVVQMSLPRNASPEELFKIGNTLSDLRKTGTMIISVGNLVYHQNTYDFDNKYKEPDSWAKELVSWFDERIKSRSYGELFQMNTLAPHINKIDQDRLRSLFFMLGTVGDKDTKIPIFDQFYYGDNSMNSFAYIKNK